MALLQGAFPIWIVSPVIGRAEAEQRRSGLSADTRRGARPTHEPWLEWRFVSADAVLGGVE